MNAFFLYAIVMVAGASGTLEEQIESFFPLYDIPYPALEEREVMSTDKVAEIQQQWAAAKQSGLLLQREAVMDKLASGKFYLPYKNPELVDIVVNILKVEYECFIKYNDKIWEPVADISLAHCVEEIPHKPMTDNEDAWAAAERWPDYQSWLCNVAISTFSPEIYSIVTKSVFLSGVGSTECGEYLSRINTGQYLDAVLDGELVSRGDGIPNFAYDLDNERITYNTLGEVIDTIIYIFIRRPDLHNTYYDHVANLINNLVSQSETKGLTQNQQVILSINRLRRLLDEVFTPPPPQY